MSEENENNILIIVAARLARRECLTQLHDLCELEQRVVSTRNVRDAVEHAEGVITRECSKIVRGHDMIAKKLRDAESEVARLNEQVRALAAEASIQDFIISAVRDLARESDGVTGWHRNGDVASWDEVLPELAYSITPATDAILREVGAKAISCLADAYAERVSELSPDNPELVAEATAREKDVRAWAESFRLAGKP